MSNLTFRGAQLRHIGWDNPGVSVFVCKFLAILSRPVMRELGHEDVFFDSAAPRTQKIMDAAAERRVKGRHAIQSITLEPSDFPQRTVELKASELEYEAYAIKAKEENMPPDGHIQIWVTMPGPAKDLAKYWETVCQSDAALKVKVADAPPADPQAKLDIQEEQPAEEATTESEEEGGPALASRGHMDRMERM